MEVLFYVLLFILGACFGSFLCCQARRLHFRQVSKTKRVTKPEKPANPKKTTKSLEAKVPKKLPARSVCLNCGYRLKWYDNLPIFSWLFLKGKCRKCGQKIGLAELLSEIGLGLAFVLPALCRGFKFETFLLNPWLAVFFGLYLVFLLLLALLAIYDGLYGELPSLCLTFSIICAIIIVSLREWVYFSSSRYLWLDLSDTLFSVLILAGVYLVLYLISKGKWVGDGDWLLCLALALVLGHPFRATLTLFLSNFLASLVMLPVVKKTKNPKIYFGPFLVIAFILVLSTNFML